MEAVIYLDTHVVVWLAGAPGELSDYAKNAIRGASQLLISPMVELELEYLYEVGRIRYDADAVLGHVRRSLNLKYCDRPFSAVVVEAKKIKWTRDPFDRIITAQAALGSHPLLSRDKIVQANYRQARW